MSVSVGMPLSDVVGTEVSFKASTGPSMLGDVLAATGFDAHEQDIADTKAPEQSFANLVSANAAPRATR